MNCACGAGRQVRGWLAMAFGVLCPAVLALGQTHSDLWGRSGEAWSPQSRLPDFSFAGYHCGEDPIPRVGAVTDVTRFGARGDGKTDCTEAFIQAIEATDRGAITIPPGRYIISDILWIRKPGIVLRGAGPGKTVLYFPRQLEDVRPNMGATTSGKPTSNYSWSGGFIWAKGTFQNKMVSSISGHVPRGETAISLDAPPRQALRKGQRVVIEMRDDDPRSLIDHLYSGDPGDTAKIVQPIRVSMINRVAAVHGTRITLDRPLRFDVRQAWTPVLKTYVPTVTEVGIEDLTLEFPVQPYPGHLFEERGMNGIAMNQVSDCWVRNVQISNSDSGIYLSGDFCTAEGILLDSKRPQGRGTTGHHGISFGNDCLLQDFEYQTHFVHDFTVSYTRSGNVIKNGTGINLSFDHHKKAPCENLFCNLDVGKGTEIWRCGGGQSLGKHCGARGTFWAIRSDRPVPLPPAGFGPDSINLVGLNLTVASSKNPDGTWVEAIPPENLEPVDLHAAQLSRRLGRRPHHDKNRSDGPAEGKPE